MSLSHIIFDNRQKKPFEKINSFFKKGYGLVLSGLCKSIHFTLGAAKIVFILFPKIVLFIINKKIYQRYFIYNYLKNNYLYLLTKVN